MSAQADRIARIVGECDVDGSSTLSEVEAFIARFCVFPDSHALVAVTLWAAHAHMVEHFHTTPRLALLSPEAGSGKTRVLDVLDLLVPEPMFCLSASPAAIFRTLSNTQITLLVDEVDTIFTNRGKGDENSDLRALLNAGYKRGSQIPRCVGPMHEVQMFKVFCATALAGLGDLPDTIMTRAVIIRMRRRAPMETVEGFRTRVHADEGYAIRDRLAVWAQTVGAKAGASWPTMPNGICDRPQEVWEPLLAVADQAGGQWPERARAACISLCRVSADRRMSLGIRLLGDLRTIFGSSPVLPTRTILERLVGGERYGLDPDAPWRELNGQGINERWLAVALRQYSVKPEKVRIGDKTLQGYRREELWDAWQRYLPPILVQPEPMERPEHEQSDTDYVPDVPDVPLSAGSVSVGDLVDRRCASSHG